MKFLICSSVENRIESLVCAFSIIKLGYEQTQIFIFEADNNILMTVGGEIYESDVLPGDLPKGSTLFTRARFAVIKQIFVDDDLFIIDSDILMLNRPELGSLVGGSSLAMCRAYGPGKFASSVIFVGSNVDAGIRSFVGEFAKLPDESLRTALWFSDEKLQASIVTLPSHFNRFENPTKETVFLHFTNLLTQPWVKPKHPSAILWFKLFRETLAAGLISQDLVIKTANYRFSNARGLAPDFMRPNHGRSEFLNRAGQLVDDLKFHGLRSFFWCVRYRNLL